MDTLILMSNSPLDIQATIERHNWEIAQLQNELRSLKDGYTRKQLEADIQKRVAELEADIKLQELQEQMAKEEAEKEQQKHRHFWQR